MTRLGVWAHVQVRRVRWGDEHGISIVFTHRVLWSPGRNDPEPRARGGLRQAYPSVEPCSVPIDLYAIISLEARYFAQSSELYVPGLGVRFWTALDRPVHRGAGFHPVRLAGGYGRELDRRRERFRWPSAALQ